MNEATGYIKMRSVPCILFALLFSLMILGCGGDDKASTTNPSSTMPPSTGAGTEFANLNPTEAGYAADAVGKAADARPPAGSVTQSSNVSNGITLDRVSVTARYGATRNSYSIRNGSSWSIGTSDGNPVSIPGVTAPFKGSELHKRVNGGDLYVDVFSDIEAPRTRQTGGGDDGSRTLPLGTLVRPRNQSGSFGGLSDDNAFVNGEAGQLRCTGGCTIANGVATGGVWTFTPHRPPGAVDVAGIAGVVFTGEIEFTRTPGTYRGQAGYFRCLSAYTSGCGHSTSNGRLSGLQGDWIFVPSGGRTVSNPDADYLAAGIWLFVPDGAASADAIVFGAFADGSDPFRQNNLLALQGTARYNGAAAGAYSVKSVDGTELGYWSGAVVLAADFGGRSDIGTIGGSVTNLDVDDERYSGSLRLGTASIGSSSSGFFEGRVSGTVEGVAYTGRWGGQFFGNSEADGKPGSVAGTLGGRSANGAVNFLGVFGAHKQ